MPFMDVDNNYYIAALDALLVINRLPSNAAILVSDDPGVPLRQAPINALLANSRITARTGHDMVDLVFRHDCSDPG